MIEARLVYETDDFRLEYGTSPAIHHQPNVRRSSESIIGAYAVGTLSTAEKVIEWMTIGEIEAVRQRSKSKDDGPWKTDYSEMTRKTVVRRLCKYLPLSPELAQALAVEDNAESDAFAASDFLDIEVIKAVTNDQSNQLPTPTPSGSELAAQIKRRPGRPRKIEPAAGPPLKITDAIEPPAIANEADGPPRWEQLAIMLAEKQGCDAQVALARLSEFSKQTFNRPYDALEPRTLDTIETHIRDGTITVKSNND